MPTICATTMHFFANKGSASELCKKIEYKKSFQVNCYYNSNIANEKTSSSITNNKKRGLLKNLKGFINN